MYDCKAPLSRFYYPETRRIINAFIIIISSAKVCLQSVAQFDVQYTDQHYQCHFSRLSLPAL